MKWRMKLKFHFDPTYNIDKSIIILIALFFIQRLIKSMFLQSNSDLILYLNYISNNLIS